LFVLRLKTLIGTTTVAGWIWLGAPDFGAGVVLRSPVEELAASEAVGEDERRRRDDGRRSAAQSETGLAKIGALVEQQAPAAFGIGADEELDDLGAAAGAFGERERGDEAHDGGAAAKADGLPAAGSDDGDEAIENLIDGALGGDDATVEINLVVNLVHGGEGDAEDKADAAGDGGEEGDGDEQFDERHTRVAASARCGSHQRPPVRVR